MFSTDKNSKKYFVTAIACGVLAIVVNLYFYFSFLQIINNLQTFSTSLQSLQSFKIVKIGDATIRAQLLTTEPQWIQGLSGTDALAPNTGMLFDFGRSDYWGIWMKDMNFPIDVLWIDSNLKIIDVVQNMSPSSYPTNYKPHVPALYVLEIPAGTVQTNHITVGQSIKIQ